MEVLFAIIWIFIIISILIPVYRQRKIQLERYNIIKKLEKQRNSRVITLIHRQEALSLLGIPLVRYVTVEDSEQVLRAIRFTPSDLPIDLVLHTPGGLMLASEQIALALKRHPAKVSVIIPHYAMSGGTLIALASDEIILDANGVLGPVDPQIGEYPAVSILQVIHTKDKNELDDQTLIMADIARKAIRQVEQTVFCLMQNKMEEAKASELARILSEGRWTHDYPISLGEARDFGLPINENVPKLIYKLMELYPQPSQRRPTVEYIPVPYHQRENRYGGSSDFPKSR